MQHVAPCLCGGNERGEDLSNSLLELGVAGLEVLVELGLAGGSGEALHADVALKGDKAGLVLLAVLGGGGLVASLGSILSASGVGLADVSSSHFSNINLVCVTKEREWKQTMMIL